VAFHFSIDELVAGAGRRRSQGFLAKIKMFSRTTLVVFAILYPRLDAK
jgi:hypothetical protein